jgi:hypothetical protein
MYTSTAQTAAAAFTLNNMVHYYAQQAALGAGSAITNQYGFFAELNLVGATNNYGFFGVIPAGTNRWNLFMNGTANNYMAGSLGIGSTALTGYNLRIAKSITGGTSVFSVRQEGTVQADVTSDAVGFRNDLNTTGSAFTLTNYFHYYAIQNTIGAGSAVTNQYGYAVTGNMTGATNNYGFHGGIPAGTNRWNLYMAGTADNYLAGNLGVGVVPVNPLQVYKSSAGVVARFHSSASDGRLSANSGVFDISSTASDLSFTAGNIERVRVKSTGQMRFVPLASDPSGAQAGDVYYNSTTNKLKVYNGTAWETITSA